MMENHVGQQSASAGGDAEMAFKILEHLSANAKVRKTSKTPWFDSTYGT